ncbi:MAG TPA: hypothetical protein VG937_39960 [Polyangiaceae bacterium]|nr:hypothetical protein [Polyangiaceae bacterium]
MTEGLLSNVHRAPKVRVGLVGGCLCLASLAMGCAGGTETGNPSFTSALSYTGYSSKPEDIALQDGGRVASVQSAWFELDRVSVLASGACGSDAPPAFVVPALGLGDHAAGNHNSTAYQAEPGSFCAVEVPFVRVSDPAGAPAELAGRALLLTGKLADGTPFSIESDKASVVRLEAETGSFALAQGEGELLIAFDFANWLGSVDFALAERGAGGVVISSASNPTLLEAFEASLGPGIHLFRDRDGDGMLDAAPEELAHGK